MRLSVKIESTIIDVFNSKNWNICCCGSEKCTLSHGVGVSQGPVHDCSYPIESCNREFAHAWAYCALPSIICSHLHTLSSWMLDVLVLLHIKYSLYDYHLIGWKYWPRQTSRRWLGIETPTRLTQNCCQIGKTLFSKSYLSILLTRYIYNSANNYDKLRHNGNYILHELSESRNSSWIRGNTLC